MVTAGCGEVPGRLDTPWSQTGWGWGMELSGLVVTVMPTPQEWRSSPSERVQRRRMGPNREGASHVFRLGESRGPTEEPCGRQAGQLRESSSHERVRGGEDKGVHRAQAGGPGKGGCVRRG